MIVIDSSSSVKVMKHRSSDSSVSLVLTRNIDNVDVSINDSSYVTKQFYYVFSIPELTEGEYTYKVVADLTTLESGLLYYGNINEVVDSSIKEYETENKVYTYERR